METYDFPSLASISDNETFRNNTFDAAGRGRALSARFMSLERTKRSLRMWLLALVLALALAWFVINPAPGSVLREQKADPPDTGRHQHQAEAEVAPLSSSDYPLRQRAISLIAPVHAAGDESFDWPEFIELD